MRLFPRFSSGGAVAEPSSEDESRKSVVIPLMTKNTPEHVATPGLEISGYRDIIPRRADWLILSKRHYQPGAKDSEDSKQPSHDSTARVPPMKATAPRGKTIKPESYEAGAEDDPSQRIWKETSPKASPQSYIGALKGGGIKDEKKVADQAQGKGPGAEESRSFPSHGTRRSAASNSAQEGRGRQSDQPKYESISTRGQERQAPVYDGSDEDSETENSAPSRSRLELLRLNIKSIIMLLASREKTKYLTLVANNLASTTPNYSTLAADVNGYLSEILGRDSSIFLAALGCTVTALIFSVYPTDSSIFASQLKRHFPAATLDRRVFDLLSLSMTENRPEEARRLTTHILSSDEDFSHDFVTTTIEVALFSRDHDTIRAVAHGILALRKLTKWEEVGPRNYYTGTPNPVQDEEVPDIAPPATPASTPFPTHTTKSHVNFGSASAPPSATDSRFLPKENTSTSSAKAKSKETPESRLPHKIVLVDRLGFAGGKHTFNHYSTVTDKDLVVPGETGAIAVTGVYTHTNTTTGSTKVWMRGPQDTAWKDWSEEYFALKEVPHPTVPGYFLSRNRSTTYERPNFIKGIKKYAKDFRPHGSDYQP